MALLKLEKYLGVFIDHCGVRENRDLVLNYCTAVVTARNDLGKCSFSLVSHSRDCGTSGCLMQIEMI